MADSCKMLGIIGTDGYEKTRRVYDIDYVHPAIAGGGNHLGNIMESNRGENVNVRIRKLTPRECWRLMGFTDEDFDKAKEVNSDTQLYKQAGNSIVVNVLEAIFKEML